MGVRKVRTQGGAELYDQPIGSVIVPGPKRTALARLVSAEPKMIGPDRSADRMSARVEQVISDADRKHTTPPDHEPEPSKQARSIAARLQGKAAAAEPSITRAVVGETLRNGGHMERLGFRLKTEKSFGLKIDRDYVEAQESGTGESRLDVATKVRDLVRFTSVMPTGNYWEGGNALLASLQAQGHTVLKDKNPNNDWPEQGYRGRNVQMMSPEGVAYEVQVHTTESLAAAEKNHGLYNIARHQDTTPEHRAELEQEMADIFAAVPVPPGTNLTPGKR